MTRRRREIVEGATDPCVCARCGGRADVIDSRPSGNAIRRRRGCTSCGDRTTTYEIRVDDMPGKVVHARVRRALALLRDAAEELVLAVAGTPCSDEAPPPNPEVTE